MYQAKHAVKVFELLSQVVTINRLNNLFNAEASLYLVYFLVAADEKERTGQLAFISGNCLHK